jgi:biotin carboxyl carrier protein
MRADPTTAASARADSGWQRLDDLVDQIAGLAESSLGPREFWRRLLDNTVKGLAALGGAVWLRGESGRLQLECQLKHGAAAPDAQANERHERLLAHVSETRLAISLPPHSGSHGDSATDNPTDSLVLLSPVVSEGQTLAIVEIVQRPSDLPAAQEGYLRFLSAVCELAADYDRRRQFGELQKRARSWNAFEQFTESIHASLDVDRVAYQIANDGRHLIDCDRVGVALVRGRKARLASVSGVDVLERRAASVRRLEQLINAAIKIDEPLVYPDDAAQLAPQIGAALQAHLDPSHVRRLVLIPLHAAAVGDPRDGSRPIIGALVVEHFSQPEAASETSRRIEAVARQGAIALTNALDYENVPLARFWRALGMPRALVRRRQLPKTLLAAAMIVAAIAALVFVPVDFTVEGRGELLPQRRQDIFAPTDGVIAEVRVAHGDQVEAGQPLVVLRKPRLEFDRTRVTGELQTARKRLAALQALRFSPAAASTEARDQYRQRTAEEEEVKELLKSLGEQMAVLDKQEEELTVRSPMAGQVLTWDVAQLLASRPVERGHMLLSVGDPAGPWELELRIADDRIGHVLAAQQDERDELPLSFLLAMDPDHTYQGRVRNIAMTTDTLEQGGPQVLLTASVDREALPRLRPGASVVAKIDCGRRSLGFVWLHELWDAVRTRVLF